MASRLAFLPMFALTATLVTAGTLAADTLELSDGTVLQNCFVRDEGTQITVWESLDKVGGPPRVVPKSQVKAWKRERGEDWDRRPELPDLTVTYIEITPKLAGLHGRVQYDRFGRAWIGGDSTKLRDIGDDKYTKPEEIVRDLKLQWEPNEQLTFTAHVKNIGFRPAGAFEVDWLLNGELAETQSYSGALGELEAAEFVWRWRYVPGRHSVTARVRHDGPEIAKINNEATDALWAFAFTYVVSKGRVEAWHQFRSAYGTFSFEDFYRWHLDIMNLLLAQSVYPATPEGCLARVRLDQIIYADEVRDHEAYVNGQQVQRVASDGIRYDQGGWVWNDSPQELAEKKWGQTDHAWRNQTEWSLPHELGHQLGLVDWYALDYEGHEHHTWADNGAKVSHFMRHPEQMMHWHGPQLFGEADAAYLNMTLDKPRGYFGDFYFQNPVECFLRIVDINGQALPGVQVELFQRGAVVDPDGPTGIDHGAKWFSVVEDGNFYQPPISKDPVAVGTTNASGLFRLPNRPAAEVRTLNGFQRSANPWGNMNVVGPRNLMLVKVTKNGRASYFWLEQHDFVVAWFRGLRDRFEMVLQTPYGSVDSPPPPASVQVKKLDGDRVEVTWTPAEDPRERHYHDKAIGYRVYRRVSNDGLNDRPWFVVATVGPEQRSVLVDLQSRPEDVYWYRPITDRFGVTTIAGNSLESSLRECVLE
ncbi:MAG: hypothetical protein IPM18_17835 [Phycisphaerales bacterium]|nr:hypothetical protein [Phycisphaerales bacterium]